MARAEPVEISCRLWRISRTRRWGGGDQQSSSFAVELWLCRVEIPRKVDVTGLYFQELRDVAGKNQVYVILSVDTEHDIISKYRTRVAGWSKGLPLLFDVFDTSGVRGKVCWLLEYNLKEGIVAANPDSEFYTKDFTPLITEIRNRGDGMGLHPTMYGWLGGERDIPASSYNDPALWDTNRRNNDPEFVMDLITSAKNEFTRVCGVNPVGCRTGGMRYATHLASALQRNGINIDTSTSKERGYPWALALNAYYAAGDDIRCGSTVNSDVLEIPTTGYIQDSRLLDFYLRMRSRFWLHWRHPVFLSFYIHNWQAVTPDGKADIHFLMTLSLFLRYLSDHGVNFLSWTEVNNVYKRVCEND